MEKENGLCKYCNGALTQTRGELVCTNCGAVNNSIYISENSSNQIPWDHEMSPGKRVHIVDGLGSYIGYHNDGYFHDGKGTTLSSKKQYKFRKLKRKYNLRIKIGNHETDYRSLMSLNRVSGFLGISDNVKKRAAYLYKIVTTAEVNKKIEKISNHIVLVALCLMVAIRESASNAPIRLSEIVSIFKDLGHRVSGKSIVKLSPWIMVDEAFTDAEKLLRGVIYHRGLKRIISFIPKDVKEVVELYQSYNFELKEDYQLLYMNKKPNIHLESIYGF